MAAVWTGHQLRLPRRFHGGVAPPIATVATAEMPDGLSCGSVSVIAHAAKRALRSLSRSAATLAAKASGLTNGITSQVPRM